jgi:DNA polymerase type B, organellar and viral
MRKPHYWKGAGDSSAPSEIVVLDCETHHGEQARDGNGEWQTLRLGCALAYRLEGGRRTRVKELTFTRTEQFWELVRSRLNDRRPVWVVGHNLPYDLGVVSGWSVICGDRYEVQKPCISGQMFYIKGYLDGKALNFVDTVNYYHCSLAEIGKSIGSPKMPFPTPEDSDAVWARYCMNDVRVTADALDHLIRFTRSEGLGPWQPSIASLAFAALRARFLNHKVLVHCDRTALGLERAAYFGGIVDTPFIGRVPASPVYELDVCSMFPHCACGDLPYHLVRTSDRVGPRKLRELMQTYSCIAEVELDTPTEPYPTKSRSGALYPVGRFVTTLAHPELEYALNSGHVCYVRRVAWYSKAPIFKGYMEYFVERKQHYRDHIQDAFATLCKYYANSLYGKTGQTNHRWQQWGKDALEQVEVNYGLTPGALANEYDHPPDLHGFESHHFFTPIPEPFDLRCLYGVTEIKVGEGESRDSCPAIAATITSAARVLLRSYQRIAGHGHWFYSDTDSVWVDGEGCNRLCDAGCVAPGELGALDVKSVHSFLEVHGPKDYRTDRIKRIKGLKASAKPDGKGGFSQLAFPGPSEQIKMGREGGVYVAYATKRLHRQLKRSVMLPGGKTRPLVFPRENPENVKRCRRESGRT